MRVIEKKTFPHRRLNSLGKEPAIDPYAKAPIISTKSNRHPIADVRSGMSFNELRKRLNEYNFQLKPKRNG